MGNSNTKRSDDSGSQYNKKNKEKEFVDQPINYGSLVTNGIYTAAPEYDIEVVRSFILKKKLSPFYKGMEEYSDNPFPTASNSSPNTNSDPTTPLDETSISSNTETTDNDGESSHSSKKKMSKRDTLSSIDSHRRCKHESFSSMRLKKEKDLYRKSLNNNSFASTSSPAFPDVANVSSKVDPEHPLYTKEEFFKYPIECPICYLYYPRNINYTRCCDQPICTECFIQIKRTYSNPEPTCCPFCVQSNFGVTYLSPDS